MFFDFQNSGQRAKARRLWKHSARNTSSDGANTSCGARPGYRRITEREFWRPSALRNQGGGPVGFGVYARLGGGGWKIVFVAQACDRLMLFHIPTQSHSFKSGVHRRRAHERTLFIGAVAFLPCAAVCEFAGAAREQQRACRCVVASHVNLLVRASCSLLSACVCVLWNPGATGGELRPPGRLQRAHGGGHRRREPDVLSGVQELCAQKRSCLSCAMRVRGGGAGEVGMQRGPIFSKDGARETEIQK